MTTQMQQTITNVRRARLGNWIAGVASAALVAGAIAVAATGLGSQHESRSDSYSGGSNVVYGIDLPHGARFEQLPQGVRDYIPAELPSFAPAICEKQVTYFEPRSKVYGNVTRQPASRSTGTITASAA